MSDDLRDRLAAAVRPFVDKGGTWSKEQQAADAVLAVLQEEQDAYEATTEQQLQDTLRHLGRAERERAEALQAVAQACEDMAEFQRDMQRTRELLDDSRRIMAGWDSIRAERDAALATLARVERAAALADVPDGGDERAAGFNAAMAVVRIALAGPAAHDCETAPKGIRGLLEHVGIDVAGKVIAVDGVPIEEQVPCSFAVLARTHDGEPMPHAPHSWQPQPGMTPVWCPGPAGAGSTQDGA